MGGVAVHQEIEVESEAGKRDFTSQSFTPPDIKVKPLMKYSFHLCPDEGQLTFIEERKCSLPDAMTYAVDLAFLAGAEQEDHAGQFICVFDSSRKEVFRTPLAKG